MVLSRSFFGNCGRRGALYSFMDCSYWVVR